MPDDSPITFWRALRAPEFWLLVAGSALSFWGGAWWVTVPLVLAGLCIASLPKYLELLERCRVAGVMRQWWMTVALSVFNSLAAACGVHVAAVFTRWLWFWS